LGEQLDKTNKAKKSKKTDHHGQSETQKLHALLAVGTALSSEREFPKILDMIITRAQQNTHADGASVYLIEKVHQDSFGGARPQYVEKLRFHKMINQSLSSSVPTVLLDIDNNSVVGYVAKSGKSVRIRDCYTLDKNTPYQFMRDLDRALGYRTKSVLAVPIKTSKGKVLGVLQLVNKLRTQAIMADQPKRIAEKSIIAFSDQDMHLMEAFASQAAVALDNAKLTQDIANLFESFVRASVTAIESRDPTTSGHSDRVALLTVDFAKKIDFVESGPFATINFSRDQIRELRYAALLHDFGKIGVREDLLLKGKKLYPHELETVLLRLDAIKNRNESTLWRNTVQNLVQKIKDGNVENIEAELGQVLLQLNGFNQQLEQIRLGILKANESQITDKDFNVQKLLQWIESASRNLGVKLVNENEYERLAIRRGTLSAPERKEIESHVSHTFEFLRQIAWTDDLSKVPEIAHAHHEKLDGTGYPRGLLQDEIPIQSRMMTISDIYDALTAMDRPYKKAVSTERALEILHDEASEGKLDSRLLEIFIQGEIFKVVHQSPFGKKAA